jgi:hypothetical protein
MKNRRCCCRLQSRSINVRKKREGKKIRLGKRWVISTKRGIKGKYRRIRGKRGNKGKRGNNW